MEVPRPIYITETGEFCEFGDVAARSLKYPKGFPLSDEDAKKVGLLDYLQEYDKAHAKEIKAEEKAEQAEAKAVEQAETEDKAMALKEEKAVAREEAKEERAAEREAASEAKKTEEEKPASADFPTETRRIGGSGRRGS